MHRFSAAIVSITVAALLTGACSPSRAGGEQPAEGQAETAVAMAPAATSVASLPTMTIYKSPSCGCCKNWVEHVKQEGFAVEVHDLDDMAEIKNEAGVPADARSCHTAIVAGYTIEGHVPAATIKRLLDEKPKVAGLAVPGMPVGSPGMEVPGQAPDKYDVLAYQQDGSTAVYASH